MSFWLLTEPPGQWSYEWTIVEADTESDARHVANDHKGPCEKLGTLPGAPRIIWSHEHSPDTPRGGDY